jgi:hypothetical protein
MEREVDKICARCMFYMLRPRTESGGWAYCNYFNEWFPNQKEWAKGNGTKPGERTCSHWKIIGGYSELEIGEGNLDNFNPEYYHKA